MASVGVLGFISLSPTYVDHQVSALSDTALLHANQFLQGTQFMVRLAERICPECIGDLGNINVPV